MMQKNVQHQKEENNVGTHTHALNEGCDLSQTLETEFIMLLILCQLNGSVLLSARLFFGSLGTSTEKKTV